jgi:hypothetical protein
VGRCTPTVVLSPSREPPGDPDTAYPEPGGPPPWGRPGWSRSGPFHPAPRPRLEPFRHRDYRMLVVALPLFRA